MFITQKYLNIKIFTRQKYLQDKNTYKIEILYKTEILTKQKIFKNVKYILDTYHDPQAYKIT
jgi:hypothetical protein